MSRLLIADPNASFRNALALLISHRFSIQDISQASDSDTLISILSTNPPDILLLDWGLYGAPALEICHLLHKAYPELKIVLLSMNPQDYQAAYSVGATFIHKGASPEEVISILGEVLDCQNHEQDQLAGG